MITLDINQIWIILVAVGLPSGVLGIWLRKFEKKMDRRESERADLQKNLIDISVSSLELAMATAEAVQRIPDSNCNGDMTSALKQAGDRLKEFRDNERKITAKVMN